MGRMNTVLLSERRSVFLVEVKHGFRMANVLLNNSRKNKMNRLIQCILSKGHMGPKQKGNNPAVYA